MTAPDPSGAARSYAMRFQERERATRKVAFEAGVEWADGGEDRHPTELSAVVMPTVCGHRNPCPDRPRRFLSRFTDRPWRCPQCSRWWVTQHRTSYATADSGGYWVWIRAEEGKR